MTEQEFQDMIASAYTWKAARRAAIDDLISRHPRDLSPRDRARRRQVERHGEPWPPENSDDHP